MGFDYFYGFNGGDTSQWQPGPLFRNTTPIYPYIGNPDYNLVTAMADDAIEWIDRVNTLARTSPTSSTTRPARPTRRTIRPRNGSTRSARMHLFDDGWNKLRDTIFANQKRLGVIPENAELTPWPADLIKNWDQLSADEKKLFIRQADVYGGLSRLRRRTRSAG